MAHAWLPYTHRSWGPGKMLIGEPHRQCQHCGAIQNQVTAHAWMRVTGRRWLPLVGRCAEVTDSLEWLAVLHGEQKDSVQARHHSEAVLLAKENHKLIDDAGLEVTPYVNTPQTK
ncbi:hypothetical protein V0M98_33400 (plasmid) [Pseudomonas silesiensis]|uniref:hypothetical protein n=1 Tax=Pseudomonas silesiensis TaxID=1853130 RepID=UPI0030CA6250